MIRIKYFVPFIFVLGMVITLLYSKTVRSQVIGSPFLDPNASPTSTSTTGATINAIVQCPPGDYVTVDYFSYNAVSQISYPSGWQPISQAPDPTIGTACGVNRSTAFGHQQNNGDPTFAPFQVALSAGSPNGTIEITRCWINVNPITPVENGIGGPGQCGNSLTIPIDAPSINTNIQYDTLVGSYFTKAPSVITFSNPGPPYYIGDPPCDDTIGTCINAQTSISIGASGNFAVGVTDYQMGASSGSGPTGNLLITGSSAPAGEVWGGTLYALVSGLAPPPSPTATATPTATCTGLCPTPTPTLTATFTATPTAAPTPTGLPRGGRIGQIPLDIINTSRNLISNGNFAAGFTSWGTKHVCFSTDTSNPPPGIDPATGLPFTSDIIVSPNGSSACGSLSQVVNTSILPPSIDGQTHYVVSLWINSGNCPSNAVILGSDSPSTGAFASVSNIIGNPYTHYVFPIYGLSDFTINIKTTTLDSCTAYIGNAQLLGYDFPYLYTWLEYPNDGQQWADESKQIWEHVHVTPPTPNTGGTPSYIITQACSDPLCNNQLIASSHVPVGSVNSNGTYDVDVKFNYTVPPDVPTYLISTVYDSGNHVLANDLVPSADNPSNKFGGEAPWYIVGADIFPYTLDSTLGLIQNVVGPDDNVYTADAYATYSGSGSTITLSNSYWNSSNKAPNYNINDLIRIPKQQYYGKITSVNHTTGVVGVYPNPFWAFTNAQVVHTTIYASSYNFQTTQSQSGGGLFTTTADWQGLCLTLMPNQTCTASNAPYTCCTGSQMGSGTGQCAAGNYTTGVCGWTTNGMFAPQNGDAYNAAGQGASTINNFNPFDATAAVSSQVRQAYNGALFQEGLSQNIFLWDALNGRVGVVLNAGYSLARVGTTFFVSQAIPTSTATPYVPYPVLVPGAGPYGTNLSTNVIAPPTQVVNLTADSITNSTCLFNASNVSNVLIGDVVAYEGTQRIIAAINNVPSTGTTCTGGNTLQLTTSVSKTTVGACSGSGAPLACCTGIGTGPTCLPAQPLSVYSLQLADAATIGVAYDGSAGNTGNLYLNFDHSTNGKIYLNTSNWQPANNWPGAIRQYPCDECNGQPTYPIEADFYYSQRYNSGEELTASTYSSSGIGYLGLWQWLMFNDIMSIDTYPMSSPLYGFYAQGQFPSAPGTGQYYWPYPGVANIAYANSNLVGSPNGYIHRPQEGVLPSFYGTGNVFPSEPMMESMVYSILAHGGNMWSWWKGIGNGNGSTTDAPFSTDPNYGAGITVLTAPANGPNNICTAVSTPYSCCSGLNTGPGTGQCAGDLSIQVASSTNLAQGAAIDLAVSGTTKDSQLLISTISGNGPYTIGLQSPIPHGPYAAGTVVLAAYQKEIAQQTANTNVRNCVGVGLLGPIDPNAIIATNWGTTSGIANSVAITCRIPNNGTEVCITNNESCSNSKYGACRRGLLPPPASQLNAVAGSFTFGNTLTSNTVNVACEGGRTLTAVGGVITDNWAAAPLTGIGAAGSHHVYILLVSQQPTPTPRATPTATATGGPTPTPTSTPTPAPSAGTAAYFTEPL